MTKGQRAGAVAAADEEAVAWDTVLYERWKSTGAVFVDALTEVAEEVFELFPPPNGGHCHGYRVRLRQTTKRLRARARRAGRFRARCRPSPRFIEDAVARPPRRARERLSRQPTHRRLSRIQSTTTRLAHGNAVLAAPVPGYVAPDPRTRYEPADRLAKLCLAPQGREPAVGPDQQVVERFLSRPAE